MKLEYSEDDSEPEIGIEPATFQLLARRSNH